MFTPLHQQLSRLSPKPPARLLLELFVAVALTVNFFYLVKPQGAIKPNGNMYPAYTFIYLDRSLGETGDPLPKNWQARVLAPALSGKLIATHFSDARLTQQKYPTFLDLTRSQEFQNVFGFYHSAWLFLLFLALIGFRSDALLLMLGTFAGLMYNLIAPSGSYYLPWDMPALFFFTVSCLLFDKGSIRLLLPVIVLGALFKETILCCSLLVLLGSHWNWPKRVGAFLAVILATFGLNHLLMAHYGITITGTNGTASPADMFQDDLLYKNLHRLFSLNLSHIIFVNAGALFLVMLSPWRNRRDVLFKVVIITFAIGQFLRGVIDEMRVWYELLPLGWILMSEMIAPAQPAPARAAEKLPRSTASRWRSSYWLTLGTLALVALAGVLLIRPGLPKSAPTVQTVEPELQKLIDEAAKGDAHAYYELGVHLWTVKKDFTGATECFRQAAGQGHSAAKLNLALIHWNGVGQEPNYPEALRFFHEAARLGENEAMVSLGKIYQKSRGVTQDYVEAYQWLKLAALQRGQATSSDLEDCSRSMNPEQITAAKQQVTEFLRTNPFPQAVTSPAATH